MDCQNCHTVLPQGVAYCARCGSPQLGPQFQNQITQLPIPPVGSGSMLQPQNIQSSIKGEPMSSAHQEYAQYEEHAEHTEKEEDKNERLMVFSDGVIAFALTVAAITIKIPASIEQLNANGISIVLRCFMYIIAYVIVAGAWIDHHTLFHSIKRNDFVVVILNFFYLASIVMFPIGLFFLEFGVELVTNDASLGIATDQVRLGINVFLASQIVGGLALWLLWMYAKKNPRLLEAGLKPRFISYTNIRLLSKPAALMVVFIASDLFAAKLLIPLIITIVGLIARSIYLRRYRRGLDLTAGSDDTQRIQLFSDAVIGIAITLAVAQIEFPSLGDNVTKASEVVDSQGPLLHAFLVGIVIMGIYWLFHYHLFRFIKRHDSLLVFLNCCFLLGIVLMIIPINWFVNFFNQPEMAAHFFFGVWQIMTSLVLVAMWWHACRKKRLLVEGTTSEQIKQFSIIIIANPVVFLLLTIITAYVPVEPSIYIGIYLVLIGTIWLLLQWYKRHQLTSQNTIISNLS